LVVLASRSMLDDVVVVVVGEAPARKKLAFMGMAFEA